MQILLFRFVDWLFFGLSLVSALAGIYFGFGCALLLSTAGRWSTPALAAASFLALVTSLLADLRWGRIPNDRARCDRLGATNAITIRMSGLFMAVADGFAIVPIARIVDPSLSEAAMRRCIDPIWLAVSGLVAAAGVLSQVALPRITRRLVT